MNLNSKYIKIKVWGGGVLASMTDAVYEEVLLHLVIRSTASLWALLSHLSVLGSLQPLCWLRIITRCAQLKKLTVDLSLVSNPTPKYLCVRLIIYWLILEYHQPIFPDCDRPVFLVSMTGFVLVTARSSLRLCIQWQALCWWLLRWVRCCVHRWPTRHHQWSRTW